MPAVSVGRGAGAQGRLHGFREGFGARLERGSFLGAHQLAGFVFLSPSAPPGEYHATGQRRMAPGGEAERAEWNFHLSAGLRAALLAASSTTGLNSRWVTACFTSYEAYSPEKLLPGRAWRCPTMAMRRWRGEVRRISNSGVAAPSRRLEDVGARPWVSA